MAKTGQLQALGAALLFSTGGAAIKVAAFSGMQQATLSVLPWTLHGTLVSERGVRWPLERARLLLGGLGLSNAIVADDALVEVHEGVALVWVAG